MSLPHQQPDLAEANYSLGKTLEKKSDLDGAIAEYRTAIRQQAKYPEAQAALDKALKATGK